MVWMPAGMASLPVSAETISYSAVHESNAKEPTVVSELGKETLRRLDAE